jgi:3-hydroxybutyrate dehydrogenase
MVLNGKVALVTGSTSGIGLGIAKRLAQDGCHVVLTGLLQGITLDALLAQVTAPASSQVVFKEGNLMQGDGVKALVDEVITDLGSLDILVNCAGIQHVSPLESFPSEKWDAILALNLSAVFYAAQACFPLMKDKKWGRIINVGSAHSLVGSPFKSAYVAAKHGVAGLTKVIALEGAPFGITCNTICPGYVWTPLVQNQIADTAKARGISQEQVINEVMLGNQPTKRFVTIEEVAEMAAYLASPLASSVTGTCLPIDGAWTAH